MPKGGLEPPRVAPYAPQTYVSTNSTTSASEKIESIRPTRVIITWLGLEKPQDWAAGPASSTRPVWASASVSRPEPGRH